MIRKMMGDDLLKDMAKDGCLVCEPDDFNSFVESTNDT